MTTSSIRTHLLLLVLAVSIPLVALVGYGIYSDMQQTIAHTKTTLRMLAGTMISNTDGKIVNARQMLERLTLRPRVRQVDPNNCDGALKDLHELIPGFTNVVYTSLEGKVVCSALPQPGGEQMSVGNPPSFRKLLKEKRFTVGEPVFGRITGRWITVLSLPIWNEQGEMVGAMQLPLDLKVFDPHIPTDFLPADSHYGFVSENGTLIWRNHDLEGGVGTRPVSDSASSVVEVRDGEFESRSQDGVRRFFTVVPMQDTGWIAYVGVPASAVYGAARQRAMITSSIALAIIISLLLTAIAIAKRIAGPVTELARTARNARDQAPRVRATVAGPHEVAVVAQEFNTMLEARQRSEAQLRIAATAFESQEGIMISDVNHVILRVNSAFTETTGYSAEEIVGQTPSLLRPSSTRHDAAFYAAMWETIHRTGTWQGEVWNRRKNGEEFPVWLIITAVRGQDGAITHYVGTRMDITARKQEEQRSIQAAQDLWRALELVEKKERSKSHFLAATSHDLRQPLSAALLSTGSLGLTELDSRQMTIVQRIQQALTSMSGQLKSLLEVSRMEDGDIQLFRYDISTADLFQGLAGTFGPIAQAANVRLLFHPGEFVVHSDNNLISRLLGNLIDNAIRFSPGGTVLVCVRRSKEGHRIQVRDNGEGIADIHHEAVFDDYYQIGNRERGPNAGYGLGLSIVTRLARLLGCKIYLASAVGKGSVFSVLMPYDSTPH